eukprot:1757958-Amphidinium_carterae.1
MSECVFLSWHCAPGFVWRDHEVMLVEQGLSVASGSEIHVHRTREVMGSEKFEFPFVLRKFGSGMTEGEETARVENTSFRQVQLEEADDRSLKITGEGLDTAENEGVLNQNMIDKGWRIDRFCDRLVRTPPNSTRPPCFSPEDW